MGSRVELYRELLDLSVTSREATDTSSHETLLTRVGTVLGVDPENLRALNLAGTLLADLGRGLESRTRFAEMERLGGESFESVYGLGRAYEAMHDNNNARQYYEKALTMNTNDAVVLRRLGLVHQAEGQLDQAQSYLRRSLELNSNEKAFAALVDILARQHRWAELEQAASEFADSTMTSNPASGYARGQLLMGQPQFEAASREFKTAHENSPNNENFAQAYANSRAQLGQMAEALSVYEQVLRLDSCYLAALVNAGVIHQRLGRSTNAITLFEQAVDSDASYADAHANLGGAQARAGFYEKALESFKTARRLSPTLLGLDDAIPELEAISR